MKCSKKAIWLLIFIFCLALVPVSGCGGCGGGTDYSATIEQITALIEQRMQENGVTGLSIALVDDQDVIWAQGFGYADRERGIPATAETVYEIGSISKTMTATAIMQLAEDGLIDIDDPLTNYLPEFSIQPPLRSGPTPASPITIRTMLTHHSGIPGDLLNGAFTLKPNHDYNERLLSYLHREYACYPIDFVWAYSNTAYSLLGEVIAKVSGQSFEEYTDGLFEEMGMQHSSFFLNKPFLEENLARGYFRENVVDHMNNNTPAAGSVLSNVSDMARYIKMVLADGKSARGWVLKPETLAEMLTRQNKDIPLDFDLWQGLCWFLNDPELDYAGRLCHHGGDTIVFHSQLEILRDHKLGVIILSNSGTAAWVVRDVARQALKLALKEKVGIDPVEPVPPPYSPYTTRLQEELEAMAGFYVTSSGYDLVKAVPGGLEWTSGAEPAKELLPLENGRFALADSQGFQVEFSQISGRYVMVRHDDGTQVKGLSGKIQLVGEKYQPVPLSAAWRDRLGQYEITNLDPEDSSRFVPEELRIISLSIEMEERSGILVIRCTVQGTSFLLVVEPLTDTSSLVRGLGRNRGGAVQIVIVDGQEQIQLWGSLYKR